MNIQVQSQMNFGDENSLQDFFFVHRLVHIQVDGVIATNGGGSMPNSTIDSERALETWGGLMVEREIDDGGRAALLDWLQLHANLHQAEYSALQLGVAPELGVVDFAQQNQFYDWMYAHSAVHDTLDQATGTQ